MKNSSARTWKIQRDIALPRHEVWQLMSHTDHLNRAIGFPEVVFQPLPEDRNVLYREARMTTNGITMNYHEYPFNWQQGRNYNIRRVFSSGPFREFTANINFDDSQIIAGGTQLEISVSLAPANVAGALLAPKFANDSLKKTWHYIENQLQRHEQTRQREAALQPDASQPDASQPDEDREIDYDLAFLLPKPIRTPRVNEAALEVALRRLLAQSRDEIKAREHRELDREIIRRLAAFVRRRGDDEVRSMRPFHLAKMWECDAEQTLRVFLYATRAGLLDLSWQLMCPNCRVSKVEEGQMSELDVDFHCDACGVMYRADFDRYIELRFRPHAAIRDVTTGEYCIGGPFMTPHILVQQMVAPGEKRVLPVPKIDLANNAPLGPLRLRTLRYNSSLDLEADNAEENADGRILTYDDEGWNRPHSMVRGDHITVQNDTPNTILVAVEKRQWDELAVTAAHVTTMNEFRELFGSQVLAPGQSVGVQNLTIFFSDLKDSTAMYELHGDAPAFGRVRSMFDYLFNHLESNDGAIVKTIGDAVMAVFRTPEHAVRAAMAMQNDIANFNQTLSDENGSDDKSRPLVLKIGLHTGPSIVVNSNQRLDYFGRTVNLAARIQNASTGNDLVLSREVLDAPGVREILKTAPPLRPFLARLKGIDEMVELYRVSMDELDKDAIEASP